MNWAAVALQLLQQFGPQLGTFLLKLVEQILAKNPGLSPEHAMQKAVDHVTAGKPNASELA